MSWTPEFATAIATFVIAAFTIVLAISGGVQAWLTRDAINLARQEFNATHRPKIIVRNFQLRDTSIAAGKAIAAIFIAQNIGDSGAKIIEVRSGTIILKPNEKLPSDLSFPVREPFDVDLASGEREVFPANGGLVPTEGESFLIFEGSGILYCLGTVTYIDKGDTRRETGFCRRFVSRENRWERMDSDYEYAY